MKRINPMLYVGLICWALSAVFLALSMGCTLDPVTEYVYLPPIDDPIQVELGAMQYITYDGTDVIFVYENGVYPFASGTAVSAGDGIITVGDILYYLDGVGNITASYRLPCVADAVGISGSDVYSAHIEGATTRIYKNTSDQGVYPWVIDRINVTMTGDVVAYGTPGYAYYYYSLSGNEAGIIYADDGSIFVFNLDQILKTATFRDGYDYHESWSTNYFWRNTGWLLADGLWIGSNGYTWDAGGLTENAGGMYTWNSYPYPVQDVYNESPLVIPAAVRLEHGEDVTYWIECNTGYLIRYTVSLDLIEAVIRLYPADGLKSSGVLLMHSLRPILISDALYYHFGGFLYAYDFTGGAVSVIGSDVEIWKGM